MNIGAVKCTLFRTKMIGNMCLICSPRIQFMLYYGDRGEYSRVSKMIPRKPQGTQYYRKHLHWGDQYMLPVCASTYIEHTYLEGSFCHLVFQMWALHIWYLRTQIVCISVMGKKQCKSDLYVSTIVILSSTFNWNF